MVLVAVGVMRQGRSVRPGEALRMGDTTAKRLLSPIPLVGVNSNDWLDQSPPA
jgi:hypothetical protein